MQIAARAKPVGSCKIHKLRQGLLLSASGPQTPVLHSRDTAVWAGTSGLPPKVSLVTCGPEADSMSRILLPTHECVSRGWCRVGLVQGGAGCLATGVGGWSRISERGVVEWADLIGPMQLQDRLCEGRSQHRLEGTHLPTAPEGSPTKE